MKPIYSSTLIAALCLVLCLDVADAFQKPKRKSPARSKRSHVVHANPARPRQKPAANYGQYEFKLTTLDGKTIHLSDYAGKVVFVNIWAPWCGPCRTETPGFVKLYDQYKKKGFEIIGVAANTNESDVRSFMQRYGVAWPIGLNDDIPVAYHTYGLPDSYLFSPDGSVLKQFVGYTRDEVLRSFVDEALKDVKP